MSVETGPKTRIDMYRHNVDIFRRLLGRDNVFEDESKISKSYLGLHCGEVSIYIKYEPEMIVVLGLYLRGFNVDLKNFYGTRTQGGMVQNNFFFAPSLNTEDDGLTTFDATVNSFINYEELERMRAAKLI